jgi:hypothetical protein
VTIARSSVSSDSFAAEFRVTGRTSTTERHPLRRIPSLSRGSSDFVFRRPTRRARAERRWPDGNYDLRINGGTVQATLAYARPLVPNPDISKPGAGSVVPPGPVEVLFTKCEVQNPAATYRAVPRTTRTSCWPMRP